VGTNAGYGSDAVEGASQMWRISGMRQGSGSLGGRCRCSIPGGDYSGGMGAPVVGTRLGMRTDKVAHDLDSSGADFRWVGAGGKGGGGGGGQLGRPRGGETGGFGGGGGTGGGGGVRGGWWVFFPKVGRAGKAWAGLKILAAHESLRTTMFRQFRL